MNRPPQPPTMDFFAAPRREAGDRRVRIDLSGLAIVIEGLDVGLEKDLRERYAPYADDRPAGPEDLRAVLKLEPREYFIDPPPVPEDNPVLLACEGSRVRYLGYRIAGWFDTRGGRGEILLARGGYEPPVRAIENYVRSAVAWQAAERGGALVHSASAVWKGKGYLFYGPSGAGKSTLSACNTRASVLSDDLSLVLPRGDGGLDVAGSPFRGTYTGGPPVLGRFPLVAGFRIVQAPAAEVREVPHVRVLAQLIANLPFVDDAFPVRPDMFERFERTFGSLTLRHLHFRKDDSFWDAIAAAGL